MPKPRKFTPIPPATQVLLTAREAAALADVSKSTMYSWLAAGQFPPPRIHRGRVVRWHRDDVESWINGAWKPEGGSRR